MNIYQARKLVQKQYSATYSLNQGEQLFELGQKDASRKIIGAMRRAKPTESIYNKLQAGLKRAKKFLERTE